MAGDGEKHDSVNHMSIINNGYRRKCDWLQDSLSHEQTQTSHTGEIHLFTVRRLVETPLVGSLKGNILNNVLKNIPTKI